MPALPPPQPPTHISCYTAGTLGAYQRRRPAPPPVLPAQRAESRMLARELTTAQRAALSDDELRLLCAIDLYVANEHGLERGSPLAAGVDLSALCRLLNAGAGMWPRPEAVDIDWVVRHLARLDERGVIHHVLVVTPGAPGVVVGHRRWAARVAELASLAATELTLQLGAAAKRRIRWEAVI